MPSNIPPVIAVIKKAMKGFIFQRAVKSTNSAMQITTDKIAIDNLLLF
jgi:hypothetical protein